MKPYTAEILCVGTELLLGNVVNTNATDISEALSELGINVYFHTVVGDNPDRLRSAVDIAASRADIIITTGGLGPTCDDLTKQTLADAFGLKMVFIEEEAQRIRGYFSKSLHNNKMTDNNLRQAEFPESCTILRNDCGTAPGCVFRAKDKIIIMLPGPPRECKEMLQNCAVPYLKRLSNSEIASHMIRVFGMGESAMEDKLRDRMLELKNPTLAPYAKDGEAMLRVTAKARTHEEAEELMSPVILEALTILGDNVYGVDVPDLETTVIRLLARKSKRLAVAESCTGGLLSKRLTDVPGASKVFNGGVVAYSNDVKVKLLGVPAELIVQKGAVCAEVAEAMARGAAEQLGADFGVGITGIAGPTTDLTQKQVGTIFVSLFDGENVYTRALHLGSNRSRIRTMAVNHALDMLRRHMTALKIEL